MSEPSSPPAAPAPTASLPVDRERARFSAAQFLVALVLLLVFSPVVESFENGDSIEALLMTLVLVSGVFAVGRNHRVLVVAVVLMLPAVIGKWVNQFFPELVPVEVFLTFALLFISYVMLQLLLFILHAPRVNSEVLCAGISGYLLLGLIWMFAYILVSQLQPGSFSFNVGTPATHSIQGFDAFYFSYVTLSTVGYGDITPVASGARMLAMMEAMTGTLYMAVLISRLVALYSAQGSSERKD